MAIAYLDGTRLARAVVAGSRWVATQTQHLNEMNVFPVPDGDTGTNLTMTFKAVATAGTAARRERSVSRVARSLADSALMGARGNSGAIVAQFFQGMHEGMSGSAKLDPPRFGDVARRAAACAREAIAIPKEGTILTVMHDWAERVGQVCHRSGDFGSLLREGLQAARSSLARTPEQLKALAKAGVVDAGGQGFVYLLEGVAQFVETPEFENQVRDMPMEAVEPNAQARLEDASESILFRYCTEVLVRGTAIDRAVLRRDLSGFGDSIVIAGSAELARIHIHTNEPETLFERARAFGAVENTKVEDMRAQHETWLERRENHGIALVTDSTCDLPAEVIERFDIQMVPMRVQFGADSFLDKVTITPLQFYDMLARRPDFPKTSQPAPVDFLQIYQQLARSYQDIVSIHVSSDVSGTYQAALNAARRVEGAKLHVVDGRTACVGLGLVVERAAEAIAAGRSLEDVLAAAGQAIDDVELFIEVPSLNSLVRGGRVSHFKGILGRLLDLRPILAIRGGKPISVASTMGSLGSRRKFMDLIARRAAQFTGLRLAVAHVNAAAKASDYAAELRQRLRPARLEILDAAPVLGVHGGPGAIAVAVLGDRKPETG